MNLELFGLTTVDHIKELHWKVMTWGILTSLGLLGINAIVRGIFPEMNTKMYSIITLLVYIQYASINTKNMGIDVSTRIYSFKNKPHKLIEDEDTIELGRLQKNLDIHMVKTVASLYAMGMMVTEVLLSMPGRLTFLVTILMIGIILIVMFPLVWLYLYNFVKMTKVYNDIINISIYKIVYPTILEEDRALPTYEDFTKWSRLTKRERKKGYTEEDNKVYILTQEKLDNAITKDVKIMPDAFLVNEDYVEPETKEEPSKPSKAEEESQSNVGDKKDE